MKAKPAYTKALKVQSKLIKRLRKITDDREISYRELALLAYDNINNHPFLYKLLNGKVNPSLETILILYLALDAMDEFTEIINS